MKQFLFAISILPILSFGQNKFSKEKNPASLDSVVFDISPKVVAPENIQFPFKGIEVIDARYDTSKIGFIFNRKDDFPWDYKDFKRINLKDGVLNSLQNFYNTYYQLGLQANENKLLIVVKKLWIDNLPNRKFNQNRNDIERYSLQDIHVKFEYYLHKENNYFPLMRIDTVYQLTEENIISKDLKLNKNGLSFFLFTLKSLVEKYEFNNLIPIKSIGKSYSFHQIDSFNSKRFNLPILKDTELKTGVFMTFQEFLNNNPSVSKFKITKKGLLIFSDNDTFSHRYWAFYNEEGFHLSASKKTSLWRIGNSFEFFILDYVHLEKSVAGNMLSLLLDGSASGEKTRFIYSPKQIDMETGEVY